MPKQLKKESVYLLRKWRMQVKLILFAFVTTVALNSEIAGQNIARPNIMGPSGLQVNSYTGSLFFKRSDLVIPGQGLSLDISFSYNSAERSKNYGYGFGWTFSYNQFYRRDSLGLIFQSPDGRQDLYKGSNKTYTAPVGIFNVLTEYEAGKFRLTARDKTIYTFDDSTHKKLTAITDRNGNTIKLTYSGDKPVVITDASGRQVLLTWTDNLLTEIKSEAGSPAKRYSYQYNDAKCLIQVKNPGGYTMLYAYGLNRVLTGLTDWNSNLTSITYNENRAVIKLVSCMAEKTISYNTAQRKTYYTEKVDNRSVVTIYEFDVAGRLVKREGNCCGYNTAYQYDDDNNISKVTDANGKVSLYTYDKKGNVITETDPFGKTIRYTYDTAFGFVNSVTDKNGNLTKMNFDSKGNLLSVNNPLNQTVQFTYDAFGNLKTTKDRMNNISSFEYNSNGYVSTAVDAMGGNSKFTYDAWGNILTVTDAKNNTVLLSYDLLGRLLSISNAIGAVTKFKYDGNGNRISAEDATNNLTTLLYDGHNNLIRITNAIGNISQLGYDAMNNLTTLTDANGRTTTMTYNNLNRLVSETNSAGESKRYTYDGNGNRIMITKPNGNSQSLKYDELNRLISVSDQLGMIGTYTYDANNNLLSETNGKGDSRSFKYDQLRRLTAAADGKGNVYAFEYDANGNMVKETDRNGNSSTHAYDKLNRRLSTKDALNFTTSFTYDAIGNVISMKDAKNNVTQYSFNPARNLIKETFSDNSTIEYGYDLVGNVVSKKDNIGKTILFIYDKINRLIIRKYPNSADSLTYDHTGHLITAKNEAAVVQFSYDAAYRILSETLNGNSTTYQYNIGNGSIKIEYPSGRTIERITDSRNQLLRVIENNNTLTSFNYDEAGLVTEKVYGNKTSGYSAYNSNGQLTELRYNPGSFIDIGITHDKEDNPVSIQNHSNPGLSEQYTYDKMSKLTQLTGSAKQYNYNYDGVGSRISTKINGSTVSYTANTMNAYTKIGGNTSLIYDGNGNVIQDSRHSYEYDDENRMQSVDNGKTSIYKYDALGRRVQKITAYDTIHFFYDGLQVIEEQDANFNTKATYVWGSWIDDILTMNRNDNDYFYHTNSLGSILAITNSAGNLVERYEYDPFGALNIFEPNNKKISASSIGNPYTFTGRQLETETGLYFYRARHFDPTLGRFNQRDPLGYVDGAGLYTYANNNPLSLIDPLGTKGTTWCDQLNQAMRSVQDWLNNIGNTTEDRWNEGKQMVSSAKNTINKWGNEVGNEIESNWDASISRSIEAKDYVVDNILDYVSKLSSGLEAITEPGNGDFWLGKNNKFYPDNHQPNGATGKRMLATAKAKIAGAVGNLASVLDGGAKIIESYNNEGGFGKETSKTTGKVVIGWAGSTAGAAAGAKLGVLAGTFCGPFVVACSVVGGVTGFIAGSIIGEELGGQLGVYNGEGLYDIFSNW